MITMDAADNEVEALMTFLSNGEILDSEIKDRISILKNAEKSSKHVQISAHNFIMKEMKCSIERFHKFLEEHRAIWRFEKEIDGIDEYPRQLDPYEFPHKGGSPKKIRLLDTMENMEYLLKEYGVTVRWDQIKKTTVIEFPGEFRLNPSDAIEKVISLVRLNDLSQFNTVNRIAAIAHNNPFNRIVDYLKVLDDNGSGYIQQLAEHIIVENGTEPVRDKIVRMWMIMACAAADYAESTLNKEAVEKFDSIMIFVGKQGIGKTRFFKAMLPRPLRQYFNDGITIDPTDKDSVSECTQWWIVEAGEIDGLFKKVDISRFKHFLSRSFDVFRKPYERSTREYQRRTVFVGSANEQEFLKDYTGNRRYWPLLVKKLVTLTNDDLIDNAWAEAWSAYVNGKVWWPHTDMEEDLLSQVASFQIPISNEPVGEAIRDLIKQRNEAFACDIVRPTDIRNHLGSNPLGKHKIEKIPNLSVIGRIMTQHRIGTHIKTSTGVYWIIRNKEAYEQMKNSDIERYYNDFHSS